MLTITVLFYTFCVVIFIQLIFYGFVFGNFNRIKTKQQSANNLPISVIICAKNEAKNLKKFLPSVLKQDYPNFEIVLINDSSTDGTLKVMEAFKAEHRNIKIVNVKPIEAFWGNKKYALTLGIKASTHNHLLFTDADCKPISKHWIGEMSSLFSKSKTIVLGYGAYKKEKKSFLNKLIRFETLLTAIQYFSYAKLGHPYMAVGRNLAYTKEIFFEARGFMYHMDIKSGDDDLFVNQISNSSNTTICISKDSFTESNPKKTYKDWTLQKRRHLSTAKYYKTKHKAFLALFFISQLLFWILSLVLISSLFYWKIVIALIVLRYLFVMTSLSLASRKLNEKDLIPFFPLLELFLIVTQFSIFIKNLTSKPAHWK
jgi:glycosyltransferase involved in cell wall biosynthesis